MRRYGEKETGGVIQTRCYFILQYAAVNYLKVRKVRILLLNHFINPRLQGRGHKWRHKELFTDRNIFVFGQNPNR
jgi:hypothetical protein